MRKRTTLTKEMLAHKPKGTPVSYELFMKDPDIFRLSVTARLEADLKNVTPYVMSMPASTTDEVISKGAEIIALHKIESEIAKIREYERLIDMNIDFLKEYISSNYTSITEGPGESERVVSKGLKNIGRWSSAHSSSHKTVLQFITHIILQEGKTERKKHG